MNKYKIGNILALILLAFLCFSAFGKLTSSQQVMDLMGGNNISGTWLMIIGIGEAISAILFAIPATRKIGTLLLSAYFGGAIVFHMTYPGAYNPETHAFIAPAVFLVGVWIISWLRDENLFGIK